MTKSRRRKSKAVEVPETPHHNYYAPTAHWLELDKARLAHWQAKLDGNTRRIASTLKAWAALLHVPRTT